MFSEMVSKLEWDSVTEKVIMTEMAKTFEENLPDSLYLNHYQLEKTYGYTANNWKQFLKKREIEMLIESEIAGIAEISARRALQRLEEGGASAPDISAAKELLANSKLLKQKVNTRPQVILTRIPAKQPIGQVERVKEVITIGE